MKHKKITTLLVAGAFIATVGTSSAFAATTASNPYCTVNNCTFSDDHWHNGKAYAAHTAEDGHTYHANCGVANCTQTENHQHNGNHNNGGHNNGNHKSGRHH